jgi:hypothetical protein
VLLRRKPEGKIKVMDQQNKRFTDQYATYAPAGLLLKELSVKFQFQNRDI